MDLKELMTIADGQDKHGMPNSSIVILNEFWYQNGERETIDELALDTPTIKMFRSDGFTQVDLDFGSKHNVDLNYTYDVLSKFRVVENSIDDNAEKMPVTTVIILPNEYEGQYYIACINPHWLGLTAKSPVDDLSIIRMTFMEDSVLLYENEEIDSSLVSSVEDEE